MPIKKKKKKKKSCCQQQDFFETFSREAVGSAGVPARGDTRVLLAAKSRLRGGGAGSVPGGPRGPRTPAASQLRSLLPSRADRATPAAAADSRERGTAGLGWGPGSGQAAESSVLFTPPPRPAPLRRKRPVPQHLHPSGDSTRFSPRVCKALPDEISAVIYICAYSI